MNVGESIGTQMARSSAGVRRVAAILDFIAEHPQRSFTLTDLARSTKLSPATCHALLNALVEVDYLHRATDKNYVLGSALARVGQTAASHAAPLEIVQSVVQPEMRALADEFDAICSAFFHEGDEIVVRERAASLSHLGFSIATGTRLKLRPQSSAAFQAWMPQAELEAWLAAAQPQLTAQQRAELQGGIEFVREHGFIFFTHIQQAPFWKGETDTGDRRSEFPNGPNFALHLEHRYVIAAVLAPVFDAAGHAPFVLGLVGLAGEMSGQRVAIMGKRLRAACSRITAFLGGELPDGL
jgi:DNA-binding IclR family transcriptional regulator